MSDTEPAPVKLTARQAQALGLRQHGLTERQIGRAMGISAPAAHMHLKRAARACAGRRVTVPRTLNLENIEPRQIVAVL